MNLNIYKPNSKNTGAAFNFYFLVREGKASFFINAIQQHSWNDSTKTGSFRENKENPEKNISVKMGDFELGEILSSINSRIQWSGFHTFNDNKTTITFSPWDKDRKIRVGKDTSVVKSPAFGLTIVRNGSDTFKISLEPGEIEVLRRFIEKYLDVSFANSDFKSRDNNQSQEKPSEPEPSVEENDEDVPF